VPGPDVSVSEEVRGVSLASAAVGGREVLEALASPLPYPTLLAEAVLSEVEVKKSMQEEMAALEELPWFGPDSLLEGALPQEFKACPLSTAEAPALIVGAGPSAGAQEATKEAAPEGPLAQVGFTAGGGSRVDHTATSGPGAIEGEVVLIYSGEPSNMAEVA
jgi:hypothetical protein